MTGAERYVAPDYTDLQGIGARYGLQLIESRVFEDHGRDNHSYLLSTTAGKFVLTICERSRDRVVELARLLAVLERYEFPTTRLRPLPNGEPVTSWQGRPVLLKPYIEGRVIEELSGAMLRRVGALMATLHAIPPPEFLKIEHVRDLESLNGVLGAGIDPEYEEWLAERRAVLREATLAACPRGLTHSDLFFDNVLFDGAEPLAILDFEDACQDYLAYDLAMAVVGLCCSDSRVQMDRVRQLLRGYERVRPLQQPERTSLQGLVELAAMVASSWRFWKYNIYTPTTELADSHLELVGIAQSVTAIPARQFLDRLGS